MGRILTSRRRHGYFTLEEIGRKKTYSSSNSRGGSSAQSACATPLGVEFTSLELRLKHVAAIKKLSQTLRHPLHRFWPLKYPVVIDADFLPLYLPHHLGPSTPKTPATVSSSGVTAFSNLRYRAPNAPADSSSSSNGNGGACGWAERTRMLPWRCVPGIHPKDELSVWADIRCLLMQLLVQGSLIWVPVLLVWIWRRYCTTRRRKIIFVVVVLSLIFFPIRPNRHIRKWHGWRNIHRYHRTAAIVEASEMFPPRQPTIFTIFPHGVVPTAPARNS